jgi:hypothetical protein
MSNTEYTLAFGWIDPEGKIIKEEVAILMVSGSYASIEEIAAIGKRMREQPLRPRGNEPRCGRDRNL